METPQTGIVGGEINTLNNIISCKNDIVIPSEL